MSIEMRMIEELAEEILQEYTSCYSEVDQEVLAKMIYNAGYRKVKKGSWKVIRSSRENGKPSYICSVCGALYNEDVREWKGCPKCLSEMKAVISFM